ncbi:VirK/YbjX family protein [Anaerovibrio sp.]|uniref:VirK/YbjX family protein n=1 Tax=Anaerovibrio sp. TaxID=1872532 RepID=UPI0025B7C61F|nr:VirK/YbjX family protein [Anaerovibrio sp.]
MSDNKLQSYTALGKQIYDIRKTREARRYYVFVLRSVFLRGKLDKLQRHFTSTPLLTEVQKLYPFVYEQPTRAFFYNKSTFEERAEIVTKHMDYLAETLKPEVLLDIYREKDIPLWEGGDVDGKRFWASLFYEPGQRKEGILSVMLRLDEEPLYQMIFWIAPDKAGEWSMWIGAMQGPNMDDAKEVIKKITKRCHSYRTKNLILYIAQAVARGLGLKRIYAVTNYGYYANNHVRMDRKLKTSFSDFWAEAGGHPTEDNRFDILPLVEKRKSMEEVPTRKRAVYRRRFELLDEIDESVNKALINLSRSNKALELGD